MAARVTVTFQIGGMHCASCFVEIEDCIKKIPGIFSVNANYANEQVLIEYNSQQADEAALKKCIESLGFKALLLKDDVREFANIERRQEVADLKFKLIISSALTLALLLIMFVPWIPAFLKNKWLMFILATPVQFWVGWRFYVGAWRVLKRGRANMDTLIALGTSVAYGYSVFVVFFEKMLVRAGIPVYLYFDASAMIITVILLGKYLEIRAKGRASAAIKELMNLKPLMATVLSSSLKKGASKTQKTQEQWQQVPVEQVAVGDILLVKPGENIPVDGVIIKGSSTIDEHMVTGESMPVEKKEGDTVIGGTINTTGLFQMRAINVGGQTALAKIIDLVKRAQSSKAPVQSLVDAVSAFFVPIVILLAGVSFGVWMVWGPEPKILHAIVSVVSVLIIACPCALGLATPTSIMVGIGRGAKEGILIKGAQTLERAQKISTVVFDKTGTLTKGEPEVHGFRFVRTLPEIAEKIRFKFSEEETIKQYVTSLILSVEQQSTHPISESVVRYFAKESPLLQVLDVDRLEAISGFGLQALVDGHRVMVGSRRLMEQSGVVMPPDADTCAIGWSQEAKTVSFVAIDNSMVALFCVADTIRDGVPATIEKLKKMGIKTVMLTGDNKLAAQAVAQELGIDDIEAECLPEEKAVRVKNLMKAGEVVAMVGDGINDAPALAVADVGIALGDATDVALETADVALLRNDISLVPKLIKLSKATMRNIYQNLVWAFGYNIVLIPVAMGALYPLFNVLLSPMIAGAAMAFSSLSVVINALRLRKMPL